MRYTHKREAGNTRAFPIKSRYRFIRVVLADKWWPTKIVLVFVRFNQRRRVSERTIPIGIVRRRHVTTRLIGLGRDRRDRPAVACLARDRNPDLIDRRLN